VRPEVKNIQKAKAEVLHRQNDGKFTGWTVALIFMGSFLTIFITACCLMRLKTICSRKT
jgi:hypothetical protein